MRGDSYAAFHFRGYSKFWPRKVKLELPALHKTILPDRRRKFELFIQGFKFAFQIGTLFVDDP